MRFASLLTVVASLTVGYSSGGDRPGGASAQPAPPASPSVSYSVVEQWDIGGAGGIARVIVVDPVQRSEEGLLALASQLRRETCDERNIVVYIYDDPTAATMRKDAGNEHLNYADMKWHDDHMIGTYAKIANTGYHAVAMTLLGARGPSREVPLP